MKVPINKRVFRDGISRTRRIRLILLAVLLLYYGIGWKDILMNSDLLLQLNLIVLIPVLLYEEHKLHGYHYSKRIADTMNPLPASEAERYWTYNAVLVMDAILYSAAVTLPHVILICRYRDSNMYVWFEIFDDVKGSLYYGSNLLGTLMLVTFGGSLLTVAVAALCREMSHSRILFTVWFVIVSGSLLLFLPLLQTYIKTKSNWVAAPDIDNTYLTFFGVFSWDEARIPLAALILLLLIIALFALGRFFNRRYRTEYLANERGNRRMYHLLLCVVDALALTVILAMTEGVWIHTFWSITCSILLLPLVHFLVTIIYREKKLLKTVRYFGISVLAAGVVFVMCRLAYREYMSIPDDEDIFFIACDVQSPLFNVYTVGEREWKEFFRNRIQDSVKGKKVEWTPFEMTYPQEHSCTIYTHTKSRSYNIKLSETEYMALADANTGYIICEEKPVLQSNYMTEEELEQFSEIMKKEPGRTYSCVKSGFWGGKVLIDDPIWLPDDDSETIHFIPEIWYQGTGISISYLSSKQPESLKYLYGISEKKCGKKVKETMTALSERNKPEWNLFVRIRNRQSDQSDEEITIFCSDDEEIVAHYQYQNWSNVELDKGGYLPKEKTERLIAALLQYCDGDGSIEDCDVISIQAFKEYIYEGTPLREFDKEYEKKYILYVTVPHGVLDEILEEIDTGSGDITEETENTPVTSLSENTEWGTEGL